MKIKILTLLAAATFAVPAFGGFDFSIVEISKAADFKSGTIGIQINNLTAPHVAPLSPTNIGVGLDFSNFSANVTGVTVSSPSYPSPTPFAQLSFPGTLPATLTDTGVDEDGEFGMNATYILGLGGLPSINAGDFVAQFNWSVADAVVKGDSFDVSVIPLVSNSFESAIDGVPPNSFATATVSVPEPSSVIFFSLVAGVLGFKRLKRFWKK